ncbi:MAG: hypothetical protein GY757_22635 [bacterium]|nr:hypothetical protein [bacterium]
MPAPFHADSVPVKTLSDSYEGKYNANINRAWKKLGSNQIFWFGAEEVTRGELDIVEMKLINQFEPSLVNEDKRNYRKIELELFNEVEKMVDLELGKYGQYKEQ